MKNPRRIPQQWLAVAGFALAATQAHAFLVVDIGNGIQNSIMINQLQNLIKEQAEQTEQGRRHLMSLMTNDVAALRANMELVRSAAMQFKEGISKDKAFLGRYRTLFPDYTTTNKGVTIDEMNKQLNAWSRMLNQNTLDTLSLGEQVLSSLPEDQQALDRIMQNSQSAPGILQAVQAGNQAMAVIAQQLIKINTQLPLYNQADLFFKQKAQSEADMVRMIRERATSDKEAPGNLSTDKTGGGDKGTTEPGKTAPGKTAPTTTEPGKTTPATTTPGTTKPGDIGFDYKIGSDGTVEVSVKGKGIDQTIGAGKDGVKIGTGVSDGTGKGVDVNVKGGKDGFDVGVGVKGNNGADNVGTNVKGDKDGVSAGVNAKGKNGGLDVNAKGGKDGVSVGVKTSDGQGGTMDKSTASEGSGTVKKSGGDAVIVPLSGTNGH